MKLVSIAFGLIAVSGAAHAGITFKSVDQRGQESTVYIEGNRLRIEGNRQLMIFDGDKQVLTSADPAKHTYATATQAEMKEMGARMHKQLGDAEAQGGQAMGGLTPEQRQQMDQAQSQLREQMESMPPEQRKQMEQVLKSMQARQAGAGAPAHGAGATEAQPAKYEALGQKQQIAGQRCEVYRVVKADGEAEQGCFIPWGSFVKRDEVKVFDSLASFLGALSEGLGSARHGAANDWARGLRDAPGVPALRLDAEGQTKMKLTSLSRGPIAADKFTVPAGYTKREGGMFGGGDR